MTGATSIKSINIDGYLDIIPVRLKKKGNQLSSERIRKMLADPRNQKA